jgi:hypothetical protein
MKRAIFFVLCYCTLQTISSQNLVLNPGFESWETPTKPEYWTISQNCESSSAFIISGVYSCKHSGTATDRSDLSQIIPVTAGKEYRLSYYCRTEAPGTASGARIWCSWKNVSGAEIADPATKPVLQPTSYIKNITFQQYSLTTVAPAGAVSFNLEFRTYKNSSAWWDDIVFEESIITDISDSDVDLIKIYPNPASNYLHIKNLCDLQYIDILTITGTVLYSQNYSGGNEITIPVSNFPEGLFVIRMRTSDKTFYRKFIRKVKYSTGK